MDCTECLCEKACEVISFEVQSSMAKMKGVPLKYRTKSLSARMHYAREIYHRTDMRLFTQTIKAFTSVSDTLKKFTESISIGSQSPGKARYLAISRALSRATEFLCVDLKNVARKFQGIRPTYDALYGHQKKYLWNLLDRFVAEIGFVIERLLQMPEGIENGEDKQIYSLIKNMKNTFIALMDVMSDTTDMRRKTLAKYFASVTGNNFDLIPDRRENSTSFVKLRGLLTSLNEAFDTAKLTVNSTKWLNDTTRVLLATLQLYNDLREKAKELPGLLDEIDAFSQTLNEQTCNKGIDLIQSSGTDFNFEEANVLISGETAFYLNVSQSYYKSTHTKLRLSEVINKQRIKKTINKVELVEKMLIRNVTTPLLNRLDEFEKKLLQTYSTSLYLMDQLQDHYERPTILNTIARNLNVFLKPELDLKYYRFKHGFKTLWSTTHNLKDLRRVSTSSWENIP